METFHRSVRAAVTVAATAAALIAMPCAGLCASLWAPTEEPQIADTGPDNPVELGVRFRSDTAGTISGIRFFKAAANGGTHIAHLWSSTGQLLATATFTAESVSGWQQADFPTPVAISPGTEYIASYHTGTGHYSYSANFFSTGGLDAAPLHATADTSSAPNGLFAYGAAGSFPNSGWNGGNYWVDPVFTPDGTGGGTPVAGATLFAPTTVPAIADSGPDNPVELGVRFRSETAGTISGIRFYKSAANSGAHTAHLWNAAGQLLGTAVFSGETASGWQQASFPSPVPISANSDYIASYHTSVGHYSFESGFFGTGGVDRSPLHAPADGVSGPNGVFAYGPSGSFPSGGWNGGNYFVDAVFSSGGGGEQPPPGGQTGVEPAGWYAGDMHVHRSCGGSPEPITALLEKMNFNNLSVISLLADMGNGEVQDAPADLPRVNGSDDPASVPGRTVHWDAEWHWDPYYWQFPHQALGGHVVALGVSEAHQIVGEYTYPIFDWAHRANGFAGFAHMQYLDNALPETLGCCTPVEYPVETALGTSDFISEDVETAPPFETGPDNAMLAYYRLLNCGFRPGLAAGTDYPCNFDRPLGDLLTYVKPAGEMSYRSWIEGIARGRSVISRNGHNEFLDFKVNGTSGPGDEIRLAGSGSVQVTVQWNASLNLEGTIELVHNGNVIASRQAAAGPGAPQTLTASVGFTRSGWLAARRMGSSGHQVHTAAVFVMVNDAPIRTSAADAEFYVAWMDNLLAKTSPGGAWSSFFSTSREAAQERYRAARDVFSRIALEAGGTPPQPVDGTTLFTYQTPALFESDGTYELGTRFASDRNGRVTGVRIYAGAGEGGEHTVRIWRTEDESVVAGPFSWSFTAGSAGWRQFSLPVPLQVSAGSEYIVSVSNSNDRIYPATVNGFAAPVSSGALTAPASAGVWTDVPGTMPRNIWENSNYFRDVIFVAD